MGGPRVVDAEVAKGVDRVVLVIEGTDRGDVDD